MGDAAVKMVKDGSVSSIACLGVDFMAESVRSVLDMEGLHHIPVYRLSEKYIGCSLAESAEKPAYRAWLEKAKNKPNSLHVVYINTSILTKAESHALVPTIACTSSNVVKTILKAYAQVRTHSSLMIFHEPTLFNPFDDRSLI
jgi:quinolinate synthase